MKRVALAVCFSITWTRAAQNEPIYALRSYPTQGVARHGGFFQAKTSAHFYVRGSSRSLLSWSCLLRELWFSLDFVVLETIVRCLTQSLSQSLWVRCRGRNWNIIDHRRSSNQTLQIHQTQISNKHCLSFAPASALKIKLSHSCRLIERALIGKRSLGSMGGAIV